ncbi:Mannosyl-oligosaccharide 1,2-alpha-mannosidase IA [Dirofilaria immitis]
MLSLLVFSLILEIVCSNTLPKNISSSVKNETGEAHWYQPLVSPIYGEIPQFSLPFWYASSSNNFHNLPCYPPSSCGGTVPLALDQFYCSAHGSFALGTANSPSKLMREFCRFTATVNENSCSTCCKIAARHYTTPVNEVTGIMFQFDPNIPSMRTHTNSPHSSIFREKRALKTNEASVIKSSINIQNAVNSAGTLSDLMPIDHSISSSSSSSPNSVPQCFCCAPIRPIHSF